MNSFGKNLALWIIIGLLLVALFNLFQSSTTRTPQNSLAYSELINDVNKGLVKDVTIQGNNISSKFADGRSYSTYAPNDPQLVGRLIDKGVQIHATPNDDNVPSLFGILISWFPMLLLIGVWIFFMRQMQSGGGRAMGFGKSKAKLLTERHGRVTFDDVAGVDEAKEDLQEIVEFLRDPQKFQKLGGRIPRGALLVGPPGTGKTLLARAIAGEANVPFFTISGSDFVEMFVGVGASRVRDMFDQAKKNAPCIIFIDEIDAVGRHRGAGLGGGHDEREQTLNQLLVEMDGFESSEGVIIIAATNRPDVLDPAILRPGRFDRRINVPRPDLNGRVGILAVHTKKVPLAADVDLEIVSRGSPGFSGADLENLVNEAALLAARLDKDEVAMADFEMAKDKVLMGSERRSMVINEHEKKRTAWHEAGHTVAGFLLPNHDPVHKVSIIPRGPALGVTMSLPKEDRLGYSREWALDRIAMALGGRVAEEIALGDMTTGAADDFRQATHIARSMVTEWGMSEKLGPLAYLEREESFLPFMPGPRRGEYSEKTARDIDEEVHRIITDQYKRVSAMLRAHVDKVDAIAKALLERETLDSEEIVAVMEGRPLPERQRVIIPSYAEKYRRKEKRKSSLFTPRPREVPTGG